MSADAAPITYTRFSEALQDLPMDALYAKYSELTNQLFHIMASNEQLEQFVRTHNDKECYEALLENKEVIKRFEERKNAIIHEVRDVRGLPWRPREDEGAPAATNGGGERRNDGERQGEEDGGVYL